MVPKELQEMHESISKEGIIIVSIEILVILPDGILKKQKGI